MHNDDLATPIRTAAQATALTLGVGCDMTVIDNALPLEQTARPSRLTAAAAGAYVGAWVLGLALAPSSPAPDAAAAEIARHYLDHGSAVLVTSGLVHGVAGVALAAFATSLAGRPVHLARTGPLHAARPGLQDRVVLVLVRVTRGSEPASASRTPVSCSRLCWATTEARTFDQVEPAPPVSLDGPTRNHRAPDVLDSGGEGEPRLTPAVRRRLRLGSAVIVFSAAAVAGGLEVQERRHAAVEERRLAGLLQLSSEGGLGIFATPEPRPSRSVEIEMRISVRNDGPRDVTVTRASAGGLRLLAPVRLLAQTTHVLVMQETIRCDADAAPSFQVPLGPPAAPGPLHITARTARGTRTITIARPPYNTEHADFACALMHDVPPLGG